jgi:hypothetical protein
VSTATRLWSPLCLLQLPRPPGLYPESPVPARSQAQAFPSRRSDHRPAPFRSLLGIRGPQGGHREGGQKGRSSTIHTGRFELRLVFVPPFSFGSSGFRVGENTVQILPSEGRRHRDKRTVLRRDRGRLVFAAGIVSQFPQRGR